MPLFEPVIRTLNASGTRYVVVGGLATVLHGHARMTADIELIVDLELELEELGMRIPVVSMEDLMALKRLANRLQDREDIRALETIARATSKAPHE